VDSASQLQTIERYYDGVPRSIARAETIGPFTLFVNSGPGWPYYARPTLGATHFTASEVQRVRERQRDLDIPESFEWVAEISPELADAAAAAGLLVSRHPLMVLRRLSAPPAAVTSVEVQMVSPSDDLPLLSAIAGLAFANPGTSIGAQNLSDARKLVKRDPDERSFREERIRSGRSVMAMATLDGEPVGVGSHNPLGEVTEIVGVGVLPAFRRRGIAAALTRCLVQDAQARGIRTIFLSANDHDAARIYARVGFVTIATACIAD
jgi:ribosomal protein S18 acetylase RimI-like enzyme